MSPQRKAPPLGAELEALEKKDPKVKKAADSYKEMAQRVIEGRSHPLPCTIASCQWHNA